MKNIERSLSPDPGLLNQDLKGLQGNKKEKISDTSSENKPGMSRRKFLLGMITSGVTAAIGTNAFLKNRNVKHAHAEEDQVEKLENSLDHLQLKLEKLSAVISQSASADMSEAQLRILTERQNLCDEANLLLGNFRNSIADISSDEDKQIATEAYKDLKDKLKELSANLGKHDFGSELPNTIEI